MIDIIKALIEDKLNELHTMLPAKITSINYGEGTCNVKVLPKRELCSKVIEYPELIKVKLDFVKFGAWKLQFPRRVGDLVWIGFSEAAISDETSLERFSLNEPFIIGSCETSYEDNSDDIILTNNATRLEIKGDGSIIITTGNNEMTINSNVTINGNINQIGEYTQNGNYNVTGNISATGTVGATGDVQGQGISLKGHTHKYNPGPGGPTDTSSSQ